MNDENDAQRDLVEALRSGDREAARRAVAAGADPNRFETLFFLLGRSPGAGRDGVDRAGRLKTLFAVGADPEKKLFSKGTERSLLGFAVENSLEEDVVEAVAVASAEKSPRLFYDDLSPNQVSPLGLAVKRFGAFPVALQVLVDVGTEKDVWDCPAGQRALRDALDRAVTTNEIGAVMVLLDAGADPNAKNRDGESALETANACVPCVLALLEHGADPWAKTKNGQRVWEKGVFSEKAAVLVKRAALKKMSATELPSE